MRGIDTTVDLSDRIGALTRFRVEFSGRYVNLDSYWKCLTLSEAAALRRAGISVFPIFEANPTSAGYFTRDQAISDLNQALISVKHFEIPSSACLFFAVDFDASEDDLPAIRSYFADIIQSVRNRRANGYEFPGIGVYGSGRVLAEIKRYWDVRTWLSMSTGWAGYEEMKSECDVIQLAPEGDIGFDHDLDSAKDNYGF